MPTCNYLILKLFDPIMLRQLYKKGLLTIALLLSLAAVSVAQNNRVSGRITTAFDQPLAGASVLLKGSRLGGTTGPDGSFQIENVPSGNYTLVVSYIGYIRREVPVSVPGSENILLSLTEESTSLSEVMVTGVFDERKKIGASVSITTLDTKQIDRLSYTNGLDLLKNVPGVYVNSSLGEVRTQISTRGIANRPNFTYELSGLYYVSLQEDGLPLTNLNFSGYSPDYFFRSDATTKRLEAVRGGTAAITGANAPGGIFNYLSKTGGATFGGEVRAKYGLEGNGQNPFYRVDVNVGGPIGGNGWSYNVGGFYRTANGPFYMGYPMNYGGQIKANVEKKYKNGSVTVFGKYLDDHNASPVALIGQDFGNPQLAAGLKNTDSFALPATAGLSNYQLPDGTAKSFSPKDLARARETSVGINWRHSFSDRISFSNNVRYSDKDFDSNNTAATNPITLTDLVSNVTAGLLGLGVITYRDLLTKQTLATVQAAVSQTGPPSWKVLSNNLPGQDILKNGLLFQNATRAHPHITELLDQFVLTARADKMSFNLGAFIGSSNVGRYAIGTSGLAYTTLEQHPRMLDISFVNALAGGATQQITSPEGFVLTGGAFGAVDYAFNKQTFAPFFAHTWNLTDKLTFDWGLRYERTTSKGTNYVRTANDGKDGGLDKNPLTTYDRGYYKNPVAYDYQFKTNTLSYSGALNYLISNNQSVYGRYSEGKKAPEFNLFQTIDAPGKADLLDPAVQSITQIEVGYKYQSSKLNLAVTPFYSKLSNILQAFTALDNTGTLYNLQPFFNSTETQGIELEATGNVSKNFSIRGVATFQTSKLLQYKSATAGPTSFRADDSFVDYSGNKADNTPQVILNITPTYAVGKFYAFLSYQYTGDRYANAPNAFILPGFSQVDLGAGYTVGKRLSLNLNINNATNSVGVVGWGAPGGFPSVFNKSDFTTSIREANPNAPFAINVTQPRAYFLTATYRF